MSLSPEFLQFITQYTNSILNKIDRSIKRKITTTFQNSDDVIPSSKLVKDEFATVRSEIPTKTSDITNDGADGTHAFIVEGDNRLTNSRDPNPHNQASSTITDPNTYSYIGNSSQNQASINNAINEKIGALMNLDIIEQVSTRPTASQDTLNKIYLVPEDTEETEDKFKAYITVYKNNSYQWERIDIARINLSDYVRKSDVDSTVVQSSSDPVTGGGVYTAIENAKTSINNSLATVATSGSYNDLTNKPSIPTKTSDLTNDNGFITEDSIDDALDEFLKQSAFISADKSIIQSGQSAILTVRIFGDISIDQNIEFYEKKANGSSILLDTVSSKNGLANYKYIGTGAGVKEFYTKVGSFVSETYSVFDCEFYDGGVTGNSNLNWNNKWNNSSDGNYMAKRTTTNDYTILTNNPDDTPSQSYYTPRNANNQIVSFDNAIIEWENFASPKTNSNRIGYFRNSSSGTSTEVSLNGEGLLTVNCHIKITVIDGVVKIYQDGTLFSTTNFNSGQSITGTQFGFQINESTVATTIKYKDFVIYPI